MFGIAGRDLKGWVFERMWIDLVWGGEEGIFFGRF